MHIWWVNEDDEIRFVVRGAGIPGPTGGILLTTVEPAAWICPEFTQNG